MFFAMFNRAWGGIVYYRRSLGHFKQNTVWVLSHSRLWGLKMCNFYESLKWVSEAKLKLSSELNLGE